MNKNRRRERKIKIIQQKTGTIFLFLCPIPKTVYPFYQLWRACFRCVCIASHTKKKTSVYIGWPFIPNAKIVFEMKFPFPFLDSARMTTKLFDCCIIGMIVFVSIWYIKFVCKFMQRTATPNRLDTKAITVKIALWQLSLWNFVLSIRIFRSFCMNFKWNFFPFWISFSGFSVSPIKLLIYVRGFVYHSADCRFHDEILINLFFIFHQLTVCARSIWTEFFRKFFIMVYIISFSFFLGRIFHTAESKIKRIKSLYVKQSICIICT